ncbi:thioesterase II family protein [Streptomyces sp. NPDC006602]|uniref:thioesterase II family protein n=1 Tax=Streptomyces sp. NPDC006602 TaxID=3364751 RepID=UPI0036A003FE
MSEKAPARRAVVPTPWLWEFPEATEASEVTLLLLPHAGGSPHTYADLAAKLPSSIRVLAGQYPGRGSRMRDPLPERLTDLVEPLTEAVERWVDGPLVVFGHSLGAMVGWQLVRRLEAAGREVGGFAPASCLPPHLARPVVDTSSRFIADDELEAYLRSLGGLPEEFFEEPELLELVMPIVRADLGLTVDYPEPGGTHRVSCPVLAIGGEADAAVPSDGLARWSECADAGMDVRVMTGGHFFYQDHLADVAGLLAEMAAAAAAAAAAQPSSRRA